MPESLTFRLSAWAQLVRLPTVFTVIADVGAAYLLMAGSAQPWWRFVLILLAGISLYWSGMVLNDVFDVERDRKERPARPIPAGQVSLAAAKAAGGGLMICGVIVAATAGWLPGLVAAVLAMMILAYDGPLKSTPVAPLAMGSCRFLSFLLGGSAALAAIESTAIPPYLLGIAGGFGIYITGVTTMARDEASGGNRSLLATGLLVIVIGLVILALVPATLGGARAWQTDPQRAFPILVGLLGFPVVIRGGRAAGQPTPRNVQQTIRTGVLSIIPLAASFAFLGAGPLWGMAVFSLLIGATALGAWFRVT